MRGPGNGMAGTLPRDKRSAVFSSQIHGRAGHPGEQPSSRAADPASSRDPAATLTALLNAAPVDLCRVSEEIRAHLDLQALIVRLAGYLTFSPDTSGTTIEEAVVVVGTDRLRVLFYLWSMLRQHRKPGKVCGQMRLGSTPSKSSEAPPGGRTARHSEMACLANFLESLGLDSGSRLHSQPPVGPSGRQEPEFFELTDMLVHDIVSFIPLIDPAFRKQHRPVSADVNASGGKSPG
jgi:hypothetical protein